MEENIEYSFDYMWRDRVEAHVDVYESGKVEFVNYTKDILNMPFGVLNKADRLDLDEFFRRRCVPENRHNIKELLASVGLEEFDAEKIIKLTHGFMANDKNWIRFDGETLTYDELRKNMIGC